MPLGSQLCDGDSCVYCSCIQKMRRRRMVSLEPYRDCVSQGYRRRAVRDAVALQDHFVRSLQIEGERNRTFQVVLPREATEFEFANMEAECLTLAQQYGLVAKPTSELSPEEWEAVHQKSLNRKDILHTCPICREYFKMDDQMLLSCSHVFHRLCLQSFELCSQLRCCPVCRAENYQKLVVKNATSLYESFSATRIQAAFRGFRVRKIYIPLLRSIRPQDPSRLKKWFANKLESATDRLLGHLAADHSEADELLQEIDNTLAISKHVYQQTALVNEPCHHLMGPATVQSPVNWPLVIDKARDRGDVECPICIEPLLRREDTVLAWLSCSHIFHVDCISTFETFIDGCQGADSRGEDHICPVCRAPYQRLVMQGFVDTLP